MCKAQADERDFGGAEWFWDADSLRTGGSVEKATSRLVSPPGSPDHSGGH